MRIEIDGVDITDFIAFRGVKWSRNDIDGPNAGRNLFGDMIRDRVNTKIRLDIACKPLSTEEHMKVLNLILPEFVSVNYEDPMFGLVSKTMYANNNSSEFCIRYRNGKELWHNVSFPLIEK